MTGAIGKQAELLFTRETKSSDRTKRQSYVLFWDASPGRQPGYRGSAFPNAFGRDGNAMS
jgi:hypothetical protein